MSRGLLFFILVLLTPLACANSFRLISSTPQQGSMIIAEVGDEVSVYLDRRQLKKTPDNKVVFGVGRDAAETITLELRSPVGSQSLAIPIRKRNWKVERVNGLPPEKVTPKSAQALVRIKNESKLVKGARQTESTLPFFAMPFVLPARGRISGVYGSQRVLNGEKKRPHFGLDIANAIGTSVIAPADGVVTMVHPDMYYSGATIVIDHGFGINSTYLHLNSIEVTVGQKVVQGETIATIGASGRATGPHLDWRLNWFQTRLDPQLLIAKMN